MIRWKVLFGSVIGAILLAPGASLAADEPTPLVIVIHPAAAPEPALKYRLLPDDASLQPGNAALFYHRGIQMMEQARRAAGREGSEEDNVSEWLSGPPEAIPIARARAWLDRNRQALHEAELGARRRDCDWGLDDRPEGFALLISEIQEMRRFIRLVALRARVDVAEGRPFDAFRHLQTGYAMCRHVSRPRFVLPMIVGLASSVNLKQATLDVIQSPGMPALYWALIDRPRPLIDPRGPVEGERLFLEREIPQLRELDGLPWSVAKARSFVADLETKFYQLSDSPSPAAMGWGDSETVDWLNRLGIVALVARSYPEAKRSLIARGRPADQVEAMPTIQVAFLDAYLSYQVYRDDLFKWAGLPYDQARGGMGDARDRMIGVKDPPLLRFLCSMASAIAPALLVSARTERNLDAIACVEAIRIHAAKHGRFPARLVEMTDTPAPVDPMTGRPFDYRLDGDRAILSASGPAGVSANSGYAFRYVLELAH